MQQTRRKQGKISYLLPKMHDTYRRCRCRYQVRARARATSKIERTKHGVDVFR